MDVTKIDWYENIFDALTTDSKYSKNSTELILKNFGEAYSEAKAGQVDAVVMRIREKCEEEIKWVKDSIDEHNRLGNHTKADEHYLPGYRKAFEEILEIIKNP